MKRDAGDFMEKTFAELYQEDKAKLKGSKSPRKSSTSAPSTSAAVLELAAVLDAQVFPRVEARPQREILEIIQLRCPMGINKSDLTESKSDVAEIYLRAIRRDLSPRANAFGLRPGFAIDLTIEKDDGGDHWDLSRKKDQDELRMLQKVERPLFLVGSPPCGPFSPLQNLSKHKRTEEENQAILAEGKTHLKVACDAYEERCRNGRFFLHEHPNQRLAGKKIVCRGFAT